MIRSISLNQHSCEFVIDFSGHLFWLPLAGSAQDVGDTIQVDSSVVSAGYDLAGITVRVARPVLTTGGAKCGGPRARFLGGPSSSFDGRSAPGDASLVIRKNSRGESQPALRGSEERQIGIFLDGIPITIGWDHRSDMSIVPMTGAQSVRVVRGSSSVLHGPNTIGGVIEVDIARGPSRPPPKHPFARTFTGRSWRDEPVSYCGKEY
ncbi:MAG: hypothetical protein CM1200mP14_20880 [Gammaproteobacteria bacterium]|nr:MAG: hypothetical protein CM1200mP14_20880 [Gammaproteobacteria bacterium]